MPRPASRVPSALLAVSFAAGWAACVNASPGQSVVVAPVEAPAPADAGAALDAGGAAGDAGAPARFRACATDEDCVAVPRVGCCHDGTNEAVAVTEREAYLGSFVCPVAHPICPLVVVRDTRTPQCDAATHLCTLVAK
jgi:hypothetical protein